MLGLFRWRRPLTAAAALSLGFFLALAPAGPSQADIIGGGANNVVLASSTAGSLTSARSSVQVASYSGPSLTSSNIADAESSDCTGCTSVAAAFQIVLFSGKPAVYSPRNAATAGNSNCISCTSFAYANQIMVQTDDPAYLTGSGQTAVQQVRNQAAAVVTGPVSDFTSLSAMCAQLDALASQLVTVLNTPGNLASRGQPLVNSTTYAPGCH